MNEPFGGRGLDCTYPPFVEAVNGLYIYYDKKRGYFIRNPKNPFSFESGYFKEHFAAVECAIKQEPPVEIMFKNFSARRKR